MKPSILISCVAVVLGIGLTRSGWADLTTKVEFDDPTGQYVDFYDDITSHVEAAMANWGRFIVGTAAFETIVLFDSSIAHASGRSVTSEFVEQVDNLDIFEQGMASEIRNDVDPNGDAPDFELVINPVYLRDELWFDPDPFSRIQSVPNDRTDAVSVFLHHVAHGLAFNGWLDPVDGTLPGDFASPFDLLSEFDGDNFFFNGPAAVTVYGGPVPQTHGNIHHFGNEGTRPGQDLISDLMNGVGLTHGTRYEISTLDLAAMHDVGLTIDANPDEGSIPGDANGDGVVDAADLNTLALDWQQEVPMGTSGDFNGDGTVNAADLNALALNWQQRVPVTVSGDTNGDGMVDAGDLNALALGWQQQVLPATGGDLNGDGFVDAADLNVMALNWQFGVGDQSEASLVSLDAAWEAALATVSLPEPGTVTLLGVAWTVMVSQRCGKRIPLPGSQKEFYHR